MRIVGYDQVPSVLPRSRHRPRADPRPAAAPLIGRTLAGAGCVEAVISFPVRRRGHLRPARLACRRPAGSTVGWRTRSPAEEPAHHHAAGPGSLEAAGRNIGRGAPGVALFETGTVASSDNGPRRSTAHTRLSEAELEKLLRHCPAAAAPGRGPRGRADPLRLVGPGADAAWSDAPAVVRRLAGELGVAVDGKVSAARMPWHRGGAPVSVDEVVIGHAGELHLNGLQGLRPAAAVPRSSWTSMR